MHERAGPSSAENSRLLIDGIVRQTTVLIAQLSTAAGIRSPLAHVADQVFLSLAHEIERGGVSRKVVADMFGLALRTYQRKVQRLEESTSVRGQTLCPPDALLFTFYRAPSPGSPIERALPCGALSLNLPIPIGACPD